MSAVVHQEGGSGGAASQDVDLNLAPIIDALVVLIAFMLASASYLAIGLLDAGVAAAGVEGTGATPPSVNVTVELSPARELVVKVTGKATSTTKLAAVEGKVDHSRLIEQMGALTEKWKDLNAVTLAAHEAVEYREIVAAMDALRKKVPVVLLGGF